MTKAKDMYMGTFAELYAHQIMGNLHKWYVDEIPDTKDADMEDVPLTGLVFSAQVTFFARWVEEMKDHHESWVPEEFQNPEYIADILNAIVRHVILGEKLETPIFPPSSCEPD